MPELVRVRLDNGAEVSVNPSFAEKHNLEVLNDEATNSRGRARRTVVPVTLKGSELDDALTAAGLSTDGKVADKQRRLAEFQASGAVVAGGSTDVGSPDA